MCHGEERGTKLPRPFPYLLEKANTSAEPHCVHAFHLCRRNLWWGMAEEVATEFQAETPFHLEIRGMQGSRRGRGTRDCGIWN